MPQPLDYERPDSQSQPKPTPPSSPMAEGMLWAMALFILFALFVAAGWAAMN